MSEASNDIAIYAAHSMRGAMAFKPILAGVHLEEFMKCAHWSSKSAFKLFYFKYVSNLNNMFISNQWL